MPTDAFVYVSPLALDRELDFAQLRGLLIADAHARYRRAIGDEVLFAPAIVGEADDERLGELRRQLDALAISFDWDRAVVTGDPEIRRWSQWLFDKLVEAGLAYERGDGWFLRMDAFNEENDRRIDELDGWSDAAREAQRKLLQRVDGFDFDAKALDGTTLSVFTGHPDSVADAEFVGLSVKHPELDRWLEDAEVRAKIERLRSGDWDGKPAEQMPVAEIGMSVQVPSVAQPLPILVSPAIDARFGTAAILGIPNADPVDKALGKALPKAGGLAWKVESKPPKTTPGHRYLVDDVPLAVGGGLHPRFEAAWTWLALAVPRDARGENPFESGGLARWLPTARSVVDAGSALGLLDVRTVAKAVGEVTSGEVAGGEPLGPTAVYGSFELADASLRAAVDSGGADAVRFAILDAAAAAKPYSGPASAVDRAAALLTRVRELAGSGVAGAGGAERIDLGDGLRRRLAGWCDTAIERIGENLEQLDLHRVTRNLVQLLNRIEDFERRVTEHRGEVAGKDAEALANALSVFAGLLMPAAPALAGELRTALSGAESEDVTWPEPQRAKAAA